MPGYGGNTTLYVGHLSVRTRRRDLEDIFSRFGRVQDVHLKHEYGFVEFSDPRDADDARHELDGREIDGRRIIVEFANETPCGPRSSRDYVGRGRPPPASGHCFNSGIEGHWARSCNSVDLKNKCHRCGERGHIARNCQNSPKNLKRGRSHSRSPSPRRGRSYSRSSGRGYSRSTTLRRDGRGAGREERLSPRRDGRGAGNQERRPISPRRSASPSKGRNQSPTPNLMSSPQPVQAYSPSPRD